MDYKEDIILWDEVFDLFSLDGPGLDERIESEKSTRSERIKWAFEQGAVTSFSGRGRQIFDLMWLGKDLESLNSELLDDLYEELDLLRKEENDKNIQLKYSHYCLSRSLRLISLYDCFGSKGTIGPGRLEPKVEEVLLEVLWERTKYKNDMAVTRNSTWWMTGSENHDFNTKACNLMSSRIFMEEDGYKDRIYPNLGYGDGIGYGEAGDFTRPEAFMHYAGRASESDGIEYVPSQHYKAWENYFIAYFLERAKKGFFLENASCGYMKWTISFILGLYNFCGSEKLKKQIRMFLDLFWADWAAQQIAGVRGGPKTRHHYEVGGYDSMTEWARFYAGGKGKTTFNYVQQLISDYAWPKVIWAMVFDPDSKKEYEYISRGIGEENPLYPRPKGVERTMLGDVESRMVKYSFVTPDYILGTQMDHPLAIFNHLAISGRWQGLVTADPNVRITTVSLDPVPGAVKNSCEYSMELMYKSLQHKNVLITQQSRRWTQINPDWYPAYDSKYYERPFGLYIGDGWEEVIESEGWVFVAKGNTYAAIHVVLLATNDDPLAWAKGTDKYKNRVVLNEESYTWNADKTILRLSNKFSPVIIEVGRKEAYKSFDNFRTKILSNTIKIHKTVVTEDTGCILVYKGCSKGAKEMVYNAANPHDAGTVGGDYIDYEHPKVFDCPYIQADYNSGVVGLKASEDEMVLDFNE